MKIEDCFQLGYIMKPHGIHGALTVFIDSDNPEQYKNLESVYVDFQHKLVPFFIDSLVLSGNKATVRFQDLTGIDQVSRYKGCSLYLPLTQLPDLEADQFYYHEIVGYTVSDRRAGSIGRVKSVYEGYGNDLFAIEYKKKEILVPIKDELILHLDKENRSIVLDLPDGLLEVYLNQ